MSKEAMKLALERLQARTDTADLGAIAALNEALAEQPAQQEPLTDIYRSFEQWKNGNVLEHGMPRTEYYSEAQLDLVEMGWNYGYDAGRAVEQALDKKAENARELGLDYEVEPKIGCVNHDCDKCEALAEQPAQWEPLTDEQIKIIWRDIDGSEGMLMRFARAIGAKLKEKNT